MRKGHRDRLMLLRDGLAQCGFGGGTDAVLAFFDFFNFVILYKKIFP